MGLKARIERGLEAFARVTSPDRYNSADRIWSWPLKTAGVRLTHDEALKLSAVWACVSVISKALASSRWEVFQEMLNGDRELRRSTTTYRLLNIRPNPEMTAFSFIEAVLIVALIWGNFYAEIERDVAGRPAALWPLEPERACLERREGSNELVLKVTNYDKPDTYLNYADVYHIHGPGVDGIAGFDMVAMAARALASALAAERFALKYYENGTAMGGVLSTDQYLDKPKLDEQRAAVKERTAGPDNAFQFLLLSGGWKFTPVAQSQRDGQNSETRYFLIEEACRYYGVPPHKIAHLLQSTNNNIEHQGLEFTRDALTPWAERCAQEADYKLLPVQGRMKVRIDTEWIGEGDAKSKAETDSILVNNGLRKRNELRRQRGYNSIGNLGELLTVQGAMTTLDKIAEAPAPRTNADQNPAQRQIAAATALFASAMKRCLTRYHARAMEAAERSKSRAEFEQKMVGHNAAHLQHVSEEINDRLAVLFSIGATFDAGKVLSEATRLTAEHGPAYVMRYKIGVPDSPWDPDERASLVAAELVHAMNGRNGST